MLVATNFAHPNRGGDLNFKVVGASDALENVEHMSVDNGVILGGDVDHHEFHFVGHRLAHLTKGKQKSDGALGYNRLPSETDQGSMDGTQRRYQQVCSKEGIIE